MKLYKNHLITGTLLLTFTGFLSRIIGFFNRIYLSQNLGAEGMGIFQLLAPIMALSFSLTGAGIQTAISKCVAACQEKDKNSKRGQYLKNGILLSFSLSFLLCLLLFEYATPIAKYFLLETRCAPLLRIYSLSLPLSAIHCCINGYYYGLKKTTLPAISQLIEQLVRVGSIFAITETSLANNIHITPAVAAAGIVFGEFGAITICLFVVHFDTLKQKITLFTKAPQPRLYLKGIIHIAFPLTLNRIVLNLLQSIEAIYIPNRLLLSGLTSAESLSLYGILTGMAFPLILFPSTLTNSISVLLLPYISEAEALSNRNRIVSAFRKCLVLGGLLGIACGVFFFLTGNFLGEFLFHNEHAGTLIVSLSLICPFLYLGGLFTSILHGLGKAFTAFWLQLISLLVRLIFVFFFIPIMGIQGYLLGILVSQLVFCLLIFIALKDYLYYN